ncbi:hypothetical protein BTE77_21135 [Ensifer adhaerens]|nr:hypothetical protein BTE77_21135 [Ensifer adhaerens]
MIFAAAEPVSRETLARVAGKDCSIDLLIDDLREELTGRPYESVFVAGGWQHRSRSACASAIRTPQASTTRGTAPALSDFEAMADGDRVFPADHPGRPIKDLRLGGQPRHHRRPTRCQFPRVRPAQPHPRRALWLCHVLSALGLQTLRDLPDSQALEDAGLLSRKGVRQEVFAARSCQAVDVLAKHCRKSLQATLLSPVATCFWLY